MLVMSSDANSTTKGEKSADTSASSTSPESSSSSGSGGSTGKSSRESVGGATAVHYGYFSNIKTPEYKSGWDDIWGKKTQSSRTNGVKSRSGTRAKIAGKSKEPVVVSLSLEDLPEEVRLALVEAARAAQEIAAKV